MSFRIPNRTQNTDLVTFSVKVDGEEVHRDHGILAVEVWRQVNRIPAAKLIISDGDAAAQDFPVSSSDIFLPGNTIEISAGYHSEETIIFYGIIIKHGIKVRERQAPVLIVECRDIVYKLGLQRKNRSFSDVTDSDAITSILYEYGMNGEVDPIEGAHEKIVQFNVTDWDFINMRAEMNGMFVVADDGLLKVKRISTTDQPARQIAYGADLLEFEAEIDARSQFNSALAQSWDSAAQEMTEEATQESTDGMPGNISHQSLADANGVDFLSLLHSGQITGNELLAWSNAMLLRSRLAMNTGRIAIRGDGEMKPCTIISLEGLGSRFMGNALVTGVRHEITGGVWTTHLSYGLKFETFAQFFRDSLHDLPASGLATAIHGLQSGIVMQLEGDPKGEFRVLVNLPALSREDEGIWARIALPHASGESGFVFRPEIGDEVVVGFMHDDPRNPVILGMMHSSAKPAPVQGSDDNHVKVLQTRSGIKIEFDDEQVAMEISTPNGNSLKINEHNGLFVLEDENGNSITMDADGITIESAKDISLKAGRGDILLEGINVEQNSNAGFKLSGGAGMEVTSSAILEIKGSLVKIN